MSDNTYQPKVYRKQGGDELVVAQGGLVTVEPGGAVQVYGQPAQIVFTKAAGASNICEVKAQVKDAQGNAIAGVFNFDLWLADTASGAGLTGTSASGTVAAKASCGVDLSTYTAKKALRVQTLADGSYTLSITDTAKTPFYVCVQAPGAGTMAATLLAAGNYGA